MSEFERVKPIEVPADWEAQLREISKTRDVEIPDKWGDLGDFERPKQDAMVYFETILNNEELSKAEEANIPGAYDPEHVHDKVLGRKMSRFTSWWLMSRFDHVNSLGSLKMGIPYAHAMTQAFVEYYTTGDIEKTYALLEQGLDEHGFK